jgi:hypothetical protein
MLRSLVSKKLLYRKIRIYYKSSEQYWKDRNRRKLVLQLLEEGHLSYRQIPECLGICERTVKRDVAKLKSYSTRRVRHQMGLLRKEADLRFQAMLEGKSWVEQLKVLERLAKEHNERNMLKKKRYKCEFIANFIWIRLNDFNSTRSVLNLKMPPIIRYRKNQFLLSKPLFASNHLAAYFYLIMTVQSYFAASFGASKSLLQLFSSWFHNKVIFLVV